ncbi:MAG: aminopeptidase P family protein, partial [Chloroflexi bacterium]|nr:aminopeptidase P family protein [Chloroflexota bacterium]
MPVLPRDEIEVPRFSAAERDLRWGRVRRLMARDDIAAIITPPNSAFFDHYSANSRYLSGVGGNFNVASVIFPIDSSDEVTAIVRPVPGPDHWRNRQDWVSDVRDVGTGWAYGPVIAERLRERKLEGGRIGLAGLQGSARFPEGLFSTGVFAAIREAVPDAELIDAGPLLDEARYVKSAEEVAMLERSIALVEDAIRVMQDEVRPGVPECAVFAHMIARMVEQGGELPTMILWGCGQPQVSGNAFMPTQRKIRAGDVITTEIEGRWAGYVGQITLTGFVGEPDAEYKAMFEVQQRAVQRCYELLKPGHMIGDLVQASIDAAEGSDFDCRVLMHGRGLGDDSPVAVFGVRDERNRTWPIEENACFVVKPTVISRDRSRTVYWGDSIVVTANGAQRLGKLPAQL